MDWLWMVLAVGAVALGVLVWVLFFAAFGHNIAQHAVNLVRPETYRSRPVRRPRGATEHPGARPGRR